MGMMPDEFWSLTKREFHLKHAAFMRQEDRARSLLFELVLMSGHVKEDKQTAVKRSINALRRYPVKKWRME